MTALNALLALVAGLSAVWVFRHPRQAAWFLLLWVPVQGWFQINLLGDSNVTVLLYELLALFIYAGLVAHGIRQPAAWGPPPLLWLAIPYFLWLALLIPRSLSNSGWLLTLIGLRSHLLPIGLVWVGYRAFASFDRIRPLAVALSIEMALIGLITALQYANLVNSWGTLIDAPLGFTWSGTLRPPGTFSTPGHLGMYVLAMVPLTLAFTTLAVTKRERFAVAAGIAGATVALIVNSQRASFVLLTLGFPLLFFSSFRNRAMRRVWAGALVALIGVGFGWRVAGEGVIDRLAAMVDDSEGVRSIPLERLSAAMSSSPWLGEGIGVASPGLQRVEMAAAELRPAESFMAALIFESGIPGLVLHYMIMAALLYGAVRSLRLCKRQDSRLLAGIISFYQLTIWLQSWSYDPLHYPPTRVLFWFWAGVALALPALETTAIQVPVRTAQTSRTPVAHRRRLWTEPA